MAKIVMNSVFWHSILILGLLSYVRGVEELVVTHAPESVKFLSNEPVRSSYLADIISSILGFTIRSNIEWNSLAAVSPWKRPEAVVVLELSGLSRIDFPLEGEKFLFENVGDLVNQFDLLTHRINERYFGKSRVMLHMDLSDELHESKITQPIMLKYIPADPKIRLQMALKDEQMGQLVRDSTFNASLASDVRILTELATVKELMKAISAQKNKVRNGVPDTYWLQMNGLQPILSTYDSDSSQCKEAIRLLRQSIAEVERTMHNVYDDKVLITVIKTDVLTTPFGHRAGRSLLQATEAVPLADADYNLAEMWDPMFPVTFAILLFVGIVLTLSVFAISVAMWNMDPGRDSIIYRLTCVRMKMD